MLKYDAKRAFPAATILAAATLAAAVLPAAVGPAIAVAAAAEPPLHTEWGDPDLRGLWSSASLTPLERPAALGDKTHFTEEEAEALKGTGMEQTLGALSATDEYKVSGELSEIWLEPGSEVVRSRSTSLVVDPPTGKVPLTPEGARRRMQVLFKRAPNAPSDSHEDRHLGDRCLLTGTLFIPNPFYLNNHQIFQSRDHVAILSEYGSEVRIIPLDGRPSLDPSIRQWAGSSRGHWEGETLVCRNDELQWSRLLPGSHGRAAPHGTLHPSRRADDRLPTHRLRPSLVHAAVESRAHPARDRGADLRVRLPRGQPRPGQHPDRGAVPREASPQKRSKRSKRSRSKATARLPAKTANR